MSVAIPSLRGAIAVPEWAKNELWRKSRVVPSLDLRFADLKSLVDATTGINLVTFTRGSGGTYVGSDGLIKTATTNEPRFTHDPVTGESLGLLVEEQRVNDLPWSENFTDPQYIPILATIGATNLLAPDGTNTATLLLETSGAGEHYIQDTLPPNKTGTVTHSVFAKAAGRNFADLRMVHVGESISTSSVRVNLTTGAITLLEGLVSASTVSVRQFPNGWYRLSVSVTLTGANTVYGWRVNSVDSATGTRNYTGDPTKGILIWGAQSEDGAFPTSYIKTTGDPLGTTRAADVASISGINFSSWYRQDEGTLFTDTYRADPVPSGAFAQAFFISDGTGNNTINIGYLTADSSQFRVRTANNNEANILPSTTNLRRITAGAYALNNVAVSENGAAAIVDYDNSAVIPSSLNQVQIGSDHVNALMLNGTIRRLVYWPQRLPNSTLQAITI